MTDLHLFRKRGDQLIPVTISIDEHRVIQGEKEELPAKAALPVNAQQAELAKRGVEFTRGADGSVTITKVPEAERQIMQFFSATAPCWFPECEKMREQYREEIRMLKAKDQTCRPCEEGAVTRKYMQRIRNIQDAIAISSARA